MRHGSLFSGIGGFDLAAEWMGWENVFHCEWMPFPRKVLHYYWPKSISYEDITKTNFTIHRGDIDILTGGFPCQPYSSAGKRLGKEDERHLWPHMLRAIREIQPSWVVGENVRGLTNWNGGLVFDEVQADLEAEGYEVLPFLLPACAVGAPHRRDRIWFVAYSESNGRNKRGEGIDGRQKHITQNWDPIRHKFTTNGEKSDVANTNGDGLNECNRKYEIDPSKGGEYAQRNTQQDDSTNPKSLGQKYALENGELEGGRFGQSNKRNLWDTFPSVSPVCDGDDGLSDRLDSITFSKWRQESIKGGGNAIVPQVALQIFRVIQQMSNLQDDAGVGMPAQNNPSP